MSTCIPDQELCYSVKFVVSRQVATFTYVFLFSHRVSERPERTAVVELVSRAVQFHIIEVIIDMRFMTVEPSLLKEVFSVAVTKSSRLIKSSEYKLWTI